MTKPHPPNTSHERGVYQTTNESEQHKPMFVMLGVGLVCLALLAGSTWLVPILLIGGGLLISIAYNKNTEEANKLEDINTTQKLKADSDLVYNEIINSTDNTPPKTKYLLYLRPFEADDYQYCDTVEYFDHAENETKRPRYYPIDFKFLDFCGPGKSSKVVCVGNREKDVGVGSIIVPDREWKELVRKLILYADHVFILPFPSKGILWEIDEIINNSDYLDKTLFLMPPAPHILGDREKKWSEVQSLLNFKGYYLPNYHKEGCITKFTKSDKRPITYWEFFEPKDPYK